MIDPIKELVYNKREPSSSDIEVFLWYKCSLSCDFCKQPHKDTVGMTLKDLDIKKEKIIDFIKNMNTNESIVTILGGEIFDDSVSNELLDYVFQMFIEINQEAKNHSKVAHFDVSTNLIFANPYRVRDFFDKLYSKYHIYVKLCVSYDVSGRFRSSNHLDLFFHNQKILEKCIDLSSFVMTKTTVEMIIEGFMDPYFDYLYSKYTMSFSQYNDNEELFGQADRTLSLRPDEPEYLKAIKILASRYPKIYNIERLGVQARKEKKSFNPCGHSKLVILPDNTSRYCIENNSCNNGCLAKQIAEEKNCLSCEYFNYCQIECFHSVLDKRIEKVKPCLQQAIYNYLKEIPLESNVSLQPH